MCTNNIIFQFDLDQLSSVLFHSIEFKKNAMAFDKLCFLNHWRHTAIKVEFPGQTGTLTLSQYCLMLSGQ